jgi:hypothetical protein
MDRHGFSSAFEVKQSTPETVLAQLIRFIAQFSALAFGLPSLFHC